MLQNGVTVSEHHYQLDGILMSAQEIALDKAKTNFFSASFLGATGNLSGIIAQAFLIPMYLSCLNAQDYGFIALATTVQSATRLLDIGVTACVAREIAISRSTQNNCAIRVIVATYETLTLAIAATALLVATISLLSKASLSSQAAKPFTQDLQYTEALFFVFLQSAGTYLTYFYTNCLVGIGRQKVITALKLSESITTGIGTLATLTLVTANLGNILKLNAAISVLFCCMYRLCLSRTVGQLLTPTSIDIKRVTDNFAFAIGAWWINAVAIAIIHADRFVLLRYLDIASYGRYCIASQIVSSTYGVVLPAIYNALLPHLAQPTPKTSKTTGNVYRFALQSVSAISAFACIAWLLLAKTLLLYWTGSATIASEVAPLAIILAIGHSANAIMVPSHTLFIATGNSRIPALISTFLAAISIPSLFYMCDGYGATGAAINFIGTNLTYIAIGFYCTYRMTGDADFPRALLTDVLPPVVVASLLYFIDMRFGFSRGSGIHLLLPYLAILSLASAFILSLMPSLRQLLFTTCGK